MAASGLDDVAVKLKFNPPVIELVVDVDVADVVDAPNVKDNGDVIVVVVAGLFGDMAAAMAGKDNELLEVVAAVVFGGVKLMENPELVVDGAV